MRISRRRGSRSPGRTARAAAHRRPAASSPVSAAVVRVDDRLLAAHLELYGSTPADRAAALAAALTTSEAWASLSAHARLVVRADPAATLGLLGTFDPAEHALVEALGWQVTDSLRRLRPLDAGAVEAGYRVLAARLRATGVSRIVGVPRGGLVLAEQLAALLGPLADGGPVAVVDDCALSGARFRRWLRGEKHGPVVFAHLASHPGVRAAIEQAEDRVLACIAAVDLVDHAPAVHGEGYEAWRARWGERSPDDYWTGHPDHVVFTWNEPDQLIWNAAEGRAERGWHVVPPDWCSKNRLLGEPPDVLAAAPGPLCPPAGVVWATWDDGARLVAAAGETVVRLQGTSARAWDGIVATGRVDGAVEAVVDAFEVSRERAAADVEAVVADLRARRLLA